MKKEMKKEKMNLKASVQVFYFMNLKNKETEKKIKKQLQKQKRMKEKNLRKVSKNRQFEIIQRGKR